MPKSKYALKQGRTPKKPAATYTVKRNNDPRKNKGTTKRMGPRREY